MNEFEMACDLCNNVIPRGAPFVSLNYNIESVDVDPSNLEPTFQVVSSEQILTLCGQCGNRRSASVVERVLKTTLRTEQPRFN